MFTKPKKNVDFQIQWKLHFVGGQFLKFCSLWSFINLPWGHVIFNTKFGPDRFSRLMTFLYKQRDKQSTFIAVIDIWITGFEYASHPSLHFFFYFKIFSFYTFSKFISGFPKCNCFKKFEVWLSLKAKKLSLVSHLYADSISA